MTATIDLHAEQGVVATSYRDIAERAQVGVGSVYHHFPMIEDLVTACGAELWRQTSPPLAADLASVEPRRVRIEELVRHVFAWYERYPSWRRGLADADKLEVLATAVARREAHLRSLVEAALAPATGDDVALARAMVDFEVFRSLKESGLTTARASALIATTLLAQS